MIRFLIALVAAVNIAVVTMADERSRGKVRLTTINQLLNAEISVDLPLASRNFHIAAIEKQIKETYDVNFPCGSPFKRGLSNVMESLRTRAVKVFVNKRSQWPTC